MKKSKSKKVKNYISKDAALLAPDVTGLPFALLISRDDSAGINLLKKARRDLKTKVKKRGKAETKKIK